MKSKCMLLFMALVFSHSLFATVYKWVDSQGQVQYSQSPPEEGTATVIAPPAPPPHSSLQEQQQAKQLEKQINTNLEQQKVNAQKAAQKAQEDKIRSMNCENAKAHLADMQSKVRVRLYDTDGNQRVLTPDERDAEITKTKETIEKYCIPLQTK